MVSDKCVEGIFRIPGDTTLVNRIFPLLAEACAGGWWPGHAVMACAIIDCPRQNDPHGMRASSPNLSIPPTHARMRVSHVTGRTVRKAGP